MNSTLPNLKKVIYAKVYYTNQCGEVTFKLPTTPTVHLRPVSDSEMMCATKLFPVESSLARATKLGNLDRWKINLLLKFSAHSSLHFVGAEAEKLFNSYKGVVYNSK